MADFNKLKDHHKNQLLAVLTHYMGQDLRHKLMAECPMAYNALCGQDIVKVVKIHDNSEVNPNYIWRDCEVCNTPFYRHKDNTNPNCAECNAQAVASLPPIEEIWAANGKPRECAKCGSLIQHTVNVCTLSPDETLCCDCYKWGTSLAEDQPSNFDVE